MLKGGDVLSSARWRDFLGRNDHLQALAGSWPQFLRLLALCRAIVCIGMNDCFILQGLGKEEGEEDNRRGGSSD